MQRVRDWFKKWFSISWKKFFLIAALVPAILYCEQTDFPKVTAFIRDALQFLNDPDDVDKSIVTVNINGKKDVFGRPFKIETFTSVMDKLMSYKPNNIILCISIKELRSDEIKKALLKYIKSKVNIYLQADYNFSQYDVSKDPVFKDFERLLYFSSSTDGNSGPNDKKPRRILLSYDKQGLAEEFEILTKLGHKPKDKNYFKYGFRLWETDQIFFKSYKAGAFGSFDASDLLADQVEKKDIEGKTVLLGSFDEFSFSGLPSIFYFSDKKTGDNFKKYFFPHVDNLASQFSTFLTGDYIKIPKNFRDLLITFILFALLIIANISSKAKLILSLSVIPFYLLVVLLAYITTSFYLDFSRSITLIFFLQYFGIPIIMFTMFKEQESKKLQEINDARIDALLTVSEKVAHDIRSPLSAINIVMTKANFDDPEYKEIFTSAVQRIDETATKILTRYRTKTGKENEIIEKINLSEIIKTILKEKRILNSKVDLKLDAPANSVTALGSKLDLERIISNIIDNSIFALKTQVNPQVEISLTTNNEMVELKIVDNGIGIPEQVLKLLGKERITTKSENNQGNGIGLLHAKRIIEKLNGKFEIFSEENKGTTINISLPKS